MSPGPPEGCRVLIVDDDDDTRRAYQRVLDRAGYTTLVAADGPSALQLVDTERPDLVLLDVVMAPVDGLAVCRRIKAERVGPSPLVLLVSSKRITPEDRVQGLEVGADGYFTRPLGNRELVAQVEAYARICGDLRASQEALRQEVEADIERLLSTVESQRRVLDERSAALQELSTQLRQERVRLESHVVDNLRNSVQPLLRELLTHEGPLQAERLKQLDEQLRKVTDPFASRLESSGVGLSARERQICVFVRSGRTSAEIARLLGLSVHTVSSHRQRIRRKLGLAAGEPLVDGLKRI